MSAPQFTKRQIADWRRYEKVRESGMFNMLTPLAREATRLDKERFMFALKNYSELKAAATGDQA